MSAAAEELLKFAENKKVKCGTRQLYEIRTRFLGYSSYKRCIGVTRTEHIQISFVELCNKYDKYKVFFHDFSTGQKKTFFYTIPRKEFLNAVRKMKNKYDEAHRILRKREEEERRLKKEQARRVTGKAKLSIGDTVCFLAPRGTKTFIHGFVQAVSMELYHVRVKSEIYKLPASSLRIVEKA